METTLKIIIIGIGATIVMDLFALLLTSIDIKSLDYRFVGRWIGHFFKGTFSHKNITQSETIANEVIIGWTAHYLIGISFAFLLYLVYGNNWLEHPTLMPALVIGILTIVAPFFLMQPAFGFGIAASNLPNPNLLRLKSLVAHTVYGVGLYVSALIVNKISPFLSF